MGVGRISSMGGGQKQFFHWGPTVMKFHFTNSETKRKTLLYMNKNTIFQNPAVASPHYDAMPGNT